VTKLGGLYCVRAEVIRPHRFLAPRSAPDLILHPMIESRFTLAAKRIL
jgi:hypothetical protein